MVFFLNRVVQKKKQATANIAGLSAHVATRACLPCRELGADNPRAKGHERSVLHCETRRSPPRCLLGSLIQNPQSSQSEHLWAVEFGVCAPQGFFATPECRDSVFPHSPMESAICDCLVGKGVRGSLHYPFGVSEKCRDVGECDVFVEGCRPYQTRLASIGSLTSSAMSMKTNLSLVFS